MPMIALSLSSARFLPVRSASTNCGVNPSNRSVYFRCHVAASLFRGNHDREHLMIYVIDNYRAPENRPLLQSMFADRKRLFVDLLGWNVPVVDGQYERSEEHTSELQSLMRISYAVFCLKKKKMIKSNTRQTLLTKTIK